MITRQQLEADGYYSAQFAFQDCFEADVECIKELGTDDEKSEGGQEDTSAEEQKKFKTEIKGDTH